MQRIEVIARQAEGTRENQRSAHNLHGCAEAAQMLGIATEVRACVFRFFPRLPTAIRRSLRAARRRLDQVRAPVRGPTWRRLIVPGAALCLLPAVHEFYRAVRARKIGMGSQS